MKLLRWGRRGLERPGIVGPDGSLRDLSAHVDDIAGQALSPEGLARIAAIDIGTLALIPQGTRLGACVGGVGNFIAIGLNYRDHARETGQPEPEQPIVFNKAPSCICGPDDDVPVPPGSSKLDWELELAIVMGDRAYCVEETEAASLIAGYAICHDVSERAFQSEMGGQWVKGKSSPNFGPLGPWLVTADEVADVGRLAMRLAVNGETMQNGTTADMIFGAHHLVAYVSRFMELLPGDVITTGTPAGVGLGMKPPRFLAPGDEVVLEIEGLGRQRQKIVE